MSAIYTPDGNFIIVDPDLGEISAPNQQEAEAELRRRKAERDRSDGGLDIVHRHGEIQMGSAA